MHHVAAGSGPATLPQSPIDSTPGSAPLVGHSTSCAMHNPQHVVSSAMAPNLLFSQVPGLQALGSGYVTSRANWASENSGQEALATPSCANACPGLHISAVV